MRGSWEGVLCERVLHLVFIKCVEVVNNWMGEREEKMGV